MYGQGPFKSPCIAFKHPRHISEAKAERTQFHNLARASHLGGAIRTPSCQSANRRNQAAMLVKPQSLGGNAELFGSLRRVQESGGRVHESPRFCLTLPLWRRPQGPGQVCVREI